MFSRKSENVSGLANPPPDLRGREPSGNFAGGSAQVSIGLCVVIAALEARRHFSRLLAIVIAAVSGGFPFEGGDQAFWGSTSHD